VYGKYLGKTVGYVGNIWEIYGKPWMIFFLGGHRGATYQYHVKNKTGMYLGT
jgi:hypothetical protein